MFVNKTNEEEEHPAVSERECKQDYGCKVTLAAKLKRVGIKRNVNLSVCVCVCVCVCVLVFVTFSGLNTDCMRTNRPHGDQDQS